MTLGHETSLKIFNRVEITLNMFCDIRIKLEINNKKSTWPSSLNI